MERTIASQVPKRGDLSCAERTTRGRPRSAKSLTLKTLNEHKTFVNVPGANLSTLFVVRKKTGRRAGSDKMIGQWHVMLCRRHGGATARVR